MGKILSQKIQELCLSLFLCVCEECTEWDLFISIWLTLRVEHSCNERRKKHLLSLWHLWIINNDTSRDCVSRLPETPTWPFFRSNLYLIVVVKDSSFLLPFDSVYSFSGDNEQNPEVKSHSEISETCFVVMYSRRRIVPPFLYGDYYRRIGFTVPENLDWLFR